MKYDQKKYVKAIYTLISIIVLWLTSYVSWELIQIKKLGYKAFVWHTHLMLPIISCFSLGLFFYILFTYFFNTHKSIPLKVFSAVFILWFSLEGMLLLNGKTKSEPEKQNGYYLSVGSYDRKNYYKTYPPDSIVEDVKKEFSFARKTNALGYPDDEWPLHANKSYIVACIGDSFTDGVGTSQDSSYVSQLEALMLKEDSNVLTLNAGISGSDPFYGFVNYRDRIAKYKPKLVVQTLSSNDILDDYRVRGGMERFNSDSTVSYAQKIPFETLYAMSYVARIFYHLAGYSYHNYSPILEPEQQQIEKDIISLFETYAEECTKNNSQLVVVLLPGLLEINTQKYRFNFDNIRDTLQQNSNLIFQDLLPIYTQIILESNNKAEAYFWPLDGHHNTLGYKLMAKSIHQVIINQKESTSQYSY